MFNKCVRRACAAVLTFAIALTGCESKPPAGNGSGGGGASTSHAAAPAGNAQPQLPPDLFVEQAPEGALEIAALRADTSRDNGIMVHGRIGGRKEPFVAGRAVFLLADMSMKACNDIAGDTCPTPWDYCCEPKENLSKLLATVQVVGSDGKPLAIPIEGTHGLTKLAEVTITGDVVTRTGGALVITARKIFVHPPRG